MIPWLLGAAGGALAFAWYGTGRISRPRRVQSGLTPADHGMPYEEAVFPSADGIPLHGWLIPGRAAAGTIIVCHGYGGEKAECLDYASFIWPSFSVLLLDLRGHGRSGGERTSLGYHECRDIAGAAQYLERHGHTPLGILGHSMGAAVAILAAAQVPELGAVVADNPFARLRDAIWCGLLRHGYPRVFARAASPLLAGVLRRRLGLPPGAGDPIEAAAEIAPRPLLLIHGADDTYIPAWHSQAIYAAAREPKRLWLVDGADHCEAYHRTGATYEREVLSFFRSAFLDLPALQRKPA